MKTSHYLLIVAACIVSVVPRLVALPVAFNFSALGALALLCGAIVRPRVLALAIPLGCRFLTDCWLEVTTGYGFYNSLAFDYGAYALICGMGAWVPRRSWLGILGAGLASGTVFFVVSNFGVWLLSPDHAYADTLAGLVECYVAAIPFARGTFMGDVMFSLLFFGVLRQLEVRIPATQSARSPLTETT